MRSGVSARHVENGHEGKGTKEGPYSAPVETQGTITQVAKKDRMGKLEMVRTDAGRGKKVNSQFLT